IQLSYGLDLIGADIINPQLGTPFASEEGEDESGQQTTTGQDYLVDHAVIGYDITINPNNQKDLLKTEDLKKFKEGIVKGTNLRKSTSKKTNSKVLLLTKFKENTYPNLGDLKTLIDVESDKISEEEKRKGNLILNIKQVISELSEFKDDIDKIDIYKASDVKIKGIDEMEEIINIKKLTSL
ncbi:MAG: type I CRISPR-associated protein Cas7, partial [Promethearchaeia archaeon]